MGACFSTKTFPAGSVATALQKENDKRIDEKLRADQAEEKKVVKCLLLGKKETGRGRGRRSERRREERRGEPQPASKRARTLRLHPMRCDAIC